MCETPIQEDAVLDLQELNNVAELSSPGGYMLEEVLFFVVSSLTYLTYLALTHPAASSLATLCFINSWVAWFLSFFKDKPDSRGGGGDGHGGLNNTEGVNNTGIQPSVIEPQETPSPIIDEPHLNTSNDIQTVNLVPEISLEITTVDSEVKTIMSKLLDDVIELLELEPIATIHWYLEAFLCLKIVDSLVQDADVHSRTARHAADLRIANLEIQNKIRNSLFSKKILENGVLINSLVRHYEAYSLEYSLISGKEFDVPKSFQRSLDRIKVDQYGKIPFFYENVIEWIQKPTEITVDVSNIGNIISESSKLPEVLDKTESVQIQDDTGEETKKGKKKSKSKSKSKRK